MSEAIQIILGGLLQGGIYGLVALGFCLVYRVTGAINLSQGAFCVLGVFIAFTLEQNYGVPGLAALCLATLVTGLIGAAIGAVAFVPGLSRLGPGGLFILTAGLLIFLQGTMLVIWGGQPYALAPLSGEAPIRVFSVRVPSQAVWILGVAIAVTGLLWWLLARTRIGLALRACADNRFAASVVGIDINRMALLSFGLAAGIAGLAGVAVAPLTSIDFATSGLFTNFGFIAVAIGGLTSFVGSMLGGLLLGVAGQTAAGYVSSLFSDGIALMLLMIVLLWRPSGLFRAGFRRRLDLRDDQHARLPVIVLDPPARRLLVGAGLLVALAPPFLLSGSQLSSLVIAWIIFIGVLGLDLLLGFAGQISLGQAGFMAVGGYAAAIASTTYNWSPVAGLGIGVALAGLSGFVLSAVTMRMRGTFLALATLAFGLMVDSLAIGLTNVTGGTSGLVGIPSLSFGGLALSTPFRSYFIIAGGVIVLLIGLGCALGSSFGRALKAIRADETAAAALGIRVRRYKLGVGAAAAALAGLSGALYAFQFHFLSPDMVSTQRSFEMLAMLVVGGEGTLVGPLLGVVLLVLLPTFAQILAVWMTAAEGLLLVLCMLWLPQGIFGTCMGWLSQGRKAAMRRRRPEPDLTALAEDIEARSPCPLGRQAAPRAALQGIALSKRFGGVQAVSDVQFTVPTGSVTAIIGPNGAGKSTLFNLLTGLYRPDGGEVRLFGERIDHLAPEEVASRGLVRSFQSARMFPGMTVRDNILVGAHLRTRASFAAQFSAGPSARREERQLRAQADALLALAGLSTYDDETATDLPMGAQKQVEVLRALMAEPKVLLFDEPAAGLNDSETLDLADLLSDIRSIGVTLVVVEHNMSLVMRVADQVIVLDAGRVVASGTPADVQKDQRVIEAYIGSDQAA